MKISISKLDSMYSKLIREERPYCEMCLSRMSTQVHHYFGRRYKSVRYDDENIVAVCFTCHRKFHEDPEAGRHFMVKKLGQDRYDRLMLRKNQKANMFAITKIIQDRYFLAF